ncbi:DUF4386 domain-containing protein [Tahibacter harae]
MSGRAAPLRAGAARWRRSSRTTAARACRPSLVAAAWTVWGRLRTLRRPEIGPHEFLMTPHALDWSPQVYARIGGLLYLVIIAFGFFAEGYVNSQLIVAGDPAATANNIAAAPLLWRISLAGNLLVPVLAVGLLVVEYVLLKPVSRPLVLLAVFFNLVSLAVEAVSKINLLEMHALLSDPVYAQAFAAPQLQALARFALESHDIAWNIALLFFGFTCLVNGYLIFKSGYLPKAVGLLLQAAGLSYLVACTTALLLPALANALLPGILLPVLVGEASFCLWLLIKGVDVVQWKARAGQ